MIRSKTGRLRQIFGTELDQKNIRLRKKRAAKTTEDWLGKKVLST